MRVALLCGSQHTLALSMKPRSFQSYANEMCGQIGLASNTLRFQTEKRDALPSKIVSHTCLVKVTHTYEFHQSPNKSLMPALRSIYEEEICSDFTINVGGNKMNANKCILAVRCLPFHAILKQSPDLASYDLDIDQPVELFEQLLVWIYSTSIEMPDEMAKIVDLLFLAFDF
jgi:hypothetical protein